MKRLYHLLSSLCMMASAGLLLSCDYIEDTRQSMVLSGEWQGDFGMYYEYVDGYGRCYTFDSYDTRITFIPAYSYAHHGTGTQVDYYAYGPYEYQYYSFRWSISDGIICLVYDYDHELDARISDYHMTNDFLTGVFSASGTSFRLRKIADFYDWTPYVNAYGFNFRINWTRSCPDYVPETRCGKEEVDDGAEASGHVLSRGRRTTPLQQ